MYELKKNGKVFTNKSVGTGPSSYGKNNHESVEKLRPRCWPEETTVCYKISLVQ